MTCRMALVSASMAREGWAGKVITGIAVPLPEVLAHHTSFANTFGAPEEPLITSVARTTSKLLPPGFRNDSPSALLSCVSSVMNSLAAFVPFSPSPATISVGCCVFGARK